VAWFEVKHLNLCELVEEITGEVRDIKLCSTSFHYVMCKEIFTKLTDTKLMVIIMT